MLADILTAGLIVSLLGGAIRLVTPVLWAALGELVTERAGVLNLGVEGNMLMGAFVAFAIASKTGSLWLGMLGAILSAMLLGIIMAFLVSTLKADQIISGLTMNILSSGLTFYLYRIIFGSAESQIQPHIDIITAYPIPVLSKLPIVGEVLFSQQLPSYVAFLMVPIVAVFLYRTRYGLELRCIGENPRALDMKGVSIPRYQYFALMVGAMMAGAGGAYLTLASSGMFLPNISAGRGWIAISIVIFGNWKPMNILLASLFFALLDSLQLHLQGIGIAFPYQFLLALPYVMTILALVLSRHRSGAPASLGLSYHRE